MKRLILILLFIPNLIYGEWVRAESDEARIKEGFPDFHSEIYWNSETSDICLVDNVSENIREHEIQLLVFIDYLFFLYPDYSQCSLAGVLSCFDNAGVLPFEFWMTREHVLRLNELSNWPEVLRWFFYSEYEKYKEYSKVV